MSVPRRRLSLGRRCTCSILLGDGDGAARQPCVLGSQRREQTLHQVGCQRELLLVPCLLDDDGERVLG